MADVLDRLAAGVQPAHVEDPVVDVVETLEPFLDRLHVDRADVVAVVGEGPHQVRANEAAPACHECDPAHRRKVSKSGRKV